jgi:hypothetical protein
MEVGEDEVRFIQVGYIDKGHAAAARNEDDQR